MHLLPGWAWVIVIIVLLVIAQSIFNWNIGALLAGLGLGGLALAYI